MGALQPEARPFFFTTLLNFKHSPLAKRYTMFMKDTWLFVSITLLACLIGAGLFFLVPGHAQSPALSRGQVSFTVLDAGTTAPQMDRRTNYVITTQDELEALWGMIHNGQGPIVPTVDFTKEEVLAVFDGSHSRGGYDIAISSVTDMDGTRVVRVVRTAPGDSCVSSEGITSPYQIVQVARTPLTHTHEDETVTHECTN